MIGPHPVRRDQLGNGLARVNREVCRLQEVRQLFGGDFTSPVCIVLVDIGLVKTYPRKSSENVFVRNVMKLIWRLPRLEW
jgi:hypothetical protein